MKALYQKFLALVGNLNDLPLLFFRLILAYGFLEPALMKLKGLQGIAEWFGSMDYPLPFLSALLATVTESLGVVLLTLGLGTRIIAVPMMFTMIVATFTVHFSNGFPAGDNGFEIPLYYFLMLFALVVYGSGKISLDHLLRKK
jgi:putative oxidoreductase